jgi:hypothetical protein
VERAPPLVADGLEGVFADDDGDEDAERSVPLPAEDAPALAQPPRVHVTRTSRAVLRRRDMDRCIGAEGTRMG